MTEVLDDRWREANFQHPVWCGCTLIRDEVEIHPAKELRRLKNPSSLKEISAWIADDNQAEEESSEVGN